MRTLKLQRLLAGLAVFSLLFAATGCKSGFSPPTMDWLSWGKKTPSTTALSSATPRRPSSTTLPSPAVTTRTTAPSSNARDLYASNPSYPTGTQANSGQSNTNGYFTGPYNTGQTPTASRPTSATNSASGQYPSSAYAGVTPRAPGANAGYQSPYQSPSASATPSDGYRTADSRSNAYGAAPSRPTTNPYSSWNTGQSQSGTAPLNSSAVAPAGYGASASPSGSASTTRTWNPPSTYPSTSSYGSPTSTAPAASPTAGLSQGLSGDYRPGSTSRDTGLLNSQTPSTSGQSPYSAGNTTSPAYPSTSGAYPSSSSSSQQPASQPSAYGGFSYPTTGQ